MVGYYSSQDNMSSSSTNEVVIDEVTHEIKEQYTIIKFDYPRKEDGPQIGAVILRLLGFGIITFVGINPNEVQVGDVGVEITHNSFRTRAQICLK